MLITHGTEPVIIFWVAIAAIVLIGCISSYLTAASRHRMIEKLAEKGQTIPPELLTRGGRDDFRYRNPVQSGIFLMCIGVAIAVFFWAFDGGGNVFQDGHVHWLPVIGIFPFMTGLARLLGGLAVKR